MTTVVASPTLIATTARVRRRYDRIAPLYDVLEGPMELGARLWRRAQWEGIGAERVLEVGVGTGRSIELYPARADVTAIDISPRMLERARGRAAALGSNADLRVADVQALPFDDGGFDIVIATFVFCSVPDPVLGLREVRRVLRPGGRLSLLEHVLSQRWWLRPVMRVLDPVTSVLWGAHIARDTAANVARSGFSHFETRDLVLDVVEIISAKA